MPGCWNAAPPSARSSPRWGSRWWRAPARRCTALEAVAETAAAARDPLSGPLRLGVIPTIGPFLLPRLMPALRTAFPRLRLWLREDQTERLVAQLEAGGSTCCCWRCPAPAAMPRPWPSPPTPSWPPCPPGHRLAARDRVPVGALAAERLLLLEDGHCLRDHALDACGLPRGTIAGRGGLRRHLAAHAGADGRQRARRDPGAAPGGGRRGAGRHRGGGAPAGGARPAPRRRAGRSLALAWRARSPRGPEFRDLAPAIAAAVAVRNPT